MLQAIQCRAHNLATAPNRFARVYARTSSSCRPLDCGGGAADFARHKVSLGAGLFFVEQNAVTAKRRKCLAITRVSCVAKVWRSRSVHRRGGVVSSARASLDPKKFLDSHKTGRVWRVRRFRAAEGANAGQPAGMFARSKLFPRGFPARCKLHPLGFSR